MDDRDHIPMATEEDWDGSKYPSNEQEKGEKKDSYFGYGYDKASGGAAGSRGSKKKVPWGIAALIIAAFIAIMLILTSFIVRTASIDNQKQADEKERRDLIAGFNSAMVSLDFDEMEKYFDTSATDEDLEDMGEYEQDGRGWSYLKSLEKPYLSFSPFRELLLENNKNITYRIGDQKENEDGSFDVDVYYDYRDIQSYPVADVYYNYLFDSDSFSIRLDSPQMEEVIHIWYETIKDADLSTLKEVSSHVIFRIKDGKILGFAAGPPENAKAGNVDTVSHKSDLSLENVMLSGFPNVQRMVDNYFINHMDSVERRREEMKEKASDSQTDGSSSDAADGSTSDGSPADGTGTGSTVTDSASTDGSTTGTQTSESTRNKGLRMNSNARTGTGSSSNNSSQEEVSHDPDDYDIEQYYEDNKDDFEDEDDAYDGFIDDEEWEDY
jgi:hypothetical protein